jgi:hypothetical protein
MKAGPTAATVEEYLDQLPADRADAFRSALALVRRNLPAGLEERLHWGMVCWEVPLSVYPETYNKQPLLVTALANQKNYLSLYLNAVYAMPELRERLTAAAPDLKMGKTCVNFKRYDQLPEAALAEVISAATPERYIAVVEQVTSRRR